MSNKAGFTLIEVLVAAVIGVILVLSVGLLGGNVVHQRTSADSNSAAMSLAEWQLEKLKAIRFPASDTALSAGHHGPVDYTAAGQPAAGAPYRVEYDVVDGISGVTDIKKITITVQHQKNPQARAELVTYYKTF